jgi:hypothetical protein
MAQALLMPLKFGLSLDDNSVTLGLSKSWTLRLRQRFGRIQSGQEQPKTQQGLCNQAAHDTGRRGRLVGALYSDLARQGERNYCVTPESQA